MRRGLFLAAILLCAPPLLRAQEAEAPAASPAVNPDSIEGTIDTLAKDAENRRAVSQQLLKSMSSGAGAESGGINPGLMKTLEQLSGTKAAKDSQAEEALRVLKEPMSLSDARFNFTTVVESRLALESKSGFWPFQDPKSDKVWPLIYKKVDLTTIRELKDDRFSACVLFGRRDRRGLVVDVDFTVDFSGEVWRVIAAKLHSVTSAKPPPLPAN